MKTPLSSLAHTRSGDKGDTANVAVIAWVLRELAPVREIVAYRPALLPRKQIQTIVEVFS